MSLLTTLVTAAEEHANVLPLNPVFYGLIAAVVFVTLGLVVFSYRDVANRHSDKTGAADHDAHTPGH